MSKEDFEATPKTANIHYGNVAGPPSAPPEIARAYSEAIKSPEVTARPIPVAVLVCHGMGQQVRFETIGQLAAAILKQATAEGCTTPETGVELSFQNESFLARAELCWRKPDGKEHSVHIYEAYWAPVTEGKVTYWDTVKFLFSAAWAGITSSRLFRSCNFQRFLFGSLKELPVSLLTKIELLVMALFLSAQVVAIAAVLARLAAQLKQINVAHFALKQALMILLPGLNVLCDPHRSSREHFVAGRFLVGWIVLVVEVFVVRYFLIQYVGDVAAYIAPYKASKFDDIRTRIQTIGLNVAKVIYGFGNVTAVPHYERVVIAGHSLGSVLAYDTLNAAINLDRTAAPGTAKGVAERTTKLITFGCPLDKTAFMFRNQSNHVDDPLREQMASAFQPLILDYDGVRKPHFWTNLYSGADIISGSLDYYDDPAVSPEDSLHVHNIRDPGAWVPLYAHVQYWTKPLLAKTLYDAVK